MNRNWCPFVTRKPVAEAIARQRIRAKIAAKRAERTAESRILSHANLVWQLLVDPTTLVMRPSPCNQALGSPYRVDRGRCSPQNSTAVSRSPCQVVSVPPPANASTVEAVSSAATAPAGQINSLT